MDSEKARTEYILNRREAESRVIAGVEYRLFRCVAVVVCCCCRCLLLLLLLLLSFVVGWRLSTLEALVDFPAAVVDVGHPEHVHEVFLTQQAGRLRV